MWKKQLSIDGVRRSYSNVRTRFIRKPHCQRHLLERMKGVRHLTRATLRPWRKRSSRS